MEGPIRFIQSTENGFQINAEAIEFFSSCEKPVVVLAVAGRYREGKSYLANYLLGEQKGFALGSTLESETKDIWVWCKPHPTLDDHLLVVLDTEGLEDPMKGDQTHDVNIFTLAVLASSYFILNSTSKIDQNSIQTLRLVTEMVEKVRVDANKEADAEDLSEHFPDFGLVLRDFFLEQEIDGSKVTPDEYLENCLKSKKGISKAVMDYNLPREVIKAAFKSRKCWCLPRPTDDKQKLLKLDEQPMEELKPEFIHEIESLKNHVLQKGRCFFHCGGNRNASQWIKICESYASAINRGACPVIKDAFQFMVEEENKKATAEAVGSYRSLMSEKLSYSPHETQDLMEFHMDSQKKAFVLFLDKAWCTLDDNFNGELLRNLQEVIDEEFKLFQRENAEFSARFCEEVMTEIYKPILDNIEKGKYTVSGGYQEYEKDRAKVRETYVRRSLGPEKEKVFHKSFFESKISEVSAVLQADKAMSQMRQESTAQRLQEERERYRSEMEETNRRRTQELEELSHKHQQQAMQDGKQKMLDKLDSVAKLCGVAGGLAGAYIGGPEMAPLGRAVGIGLGLLGRTLYCKYQEHKAKTTTAE